MVMVDILEGVYIIVIIKIMGKGLDLRLAGLVCIREFTVD